MIDYWRNVTSVCLSVTLRIMALRVSYRAKTKSCTIVFLAGMFLFVWTLIRHFCCRMYRLATKRAAKKRNGKRRNVTRPNVLTQATPAKVETAQHDSTIAQVTIISNRDSHEYCNKSSAVAVSDSRSHCQYVKNSTAAELNYLSVCLFSLLVGGSVLQLCC